MSEWLPIDSAPKDGSRILIGRVRSAGVHSAHWEVDPSWAWEGVGPCWAVYLSDDDYYSHYIPADWPTHWMPLPEPPKP